MSKVQSTSKTISRFLDAGIAARIAELIEKYDQPRAAVVVAEGDWQRLAQALRHE